VKHVKTTISTDSIHVRFADNPDGELAQSWIDFQVPLADDLPHPQRHEGSEGGKLGDPTRHYLATVQQAALRYARDAIIEEIRAQFAQVIGPENFLYFCLSLHER
jgi:hypothetical protein